MSELPARAIDASPWWQYRGGWLRAVLWVGVGLVVALALTPLVGSPARVHAGATAVTATDEPTLAWRHWVQVGRSRPHEAIPALTQLLPRLRGDPAAEIEAWIALGNLHAVTHDNEGVERVTAQLERLGRDANVSAVRVWARVGTDAVRAQQMRRHGAVGRAERLLDDALRRLPENTPIALRLRLVSQHAALLDLTSRFEAGARRFQEAIALADAWPAPLWQRAELRSSLGYVLFQAGQPERAQVLNAAALPMALESRDHRALAAVYTMEAILHGDGSLAASRPAEEEAMRTALEHARMAGSTSDEALATANLADLSLRNADYPQAIIYAERGLALARELHDVTAESVALVNAGLARLMLGQKEEGLRLAAAGLAVDERTGNQAQQAGTLRELGHYLEKAGYPDEAYAAYKRYRHLADAVFRNDLQRQLADMQEAFDHESRRREMDLLEREGRFQQAQLVSRQLELWLWAGGALTGGLLLALGGVLLRRVRAGNRVLAQANAQLAELSERDVLTGLANRHGFQAVLPAGARIDGTLMLIDIDHFKQINDAWGHAVGDEVLVEVAQRLQAAVRGDDLVVRWGGEEFLVWLRGPAVADPEALVARALAAIGETPVTVGDERIPVTASIGFATFPLEPTRAAMQWALALELVETAMYLAKAHGRNRAYGVRRAQVDGAAALAVLVRKLEAAWRDGRVELVAIDGPAFNARIPA